MLNCSLMAYGQYKAALAIFGLFCKVDDCVMRGSILSLYQLFHVTCELFKHLVYIL